MNTRRAVALLLLVVAILGVAGCRQEDAAPEFVARQRPGSGDPRPFLIGFSDIPGELSDEAYAEQFDFTANYGEAILIQRPPTWSDFLPGADVSQALRDEVLAAREAARERNLALVVALDPFDPASRDRLVSLPAEYQGRTLADGDLRDAFVEEAVFLARNMRPEYLVLGTEVNTTFERNPDAYSAFIEAYREAYDAVKGASPQTLVFVTYQFEELMGVVPELPPHAPRWDLLDDFGSRLDLLGITSYPTFAYPTARKVPPFYYLDLLEHTDRQIAFVGVGFSSGATRAGVNSSTQPEQRRFLQRLMEDAFRMQSPLVIWFSARDFAFASAPPYDLLANIGLFNARGEAKEAWPYWETTSNRPIDPEAAAALLAQQQAGAVPTATLEADAPASGG